MLRYQESILYWYTTTIENVFENETYKFSLQFMLPKNRDESTILGQRPILTKKGHLKLHSLPPLAILRFYSQGFTAKYISENIFWERAKLENQTHFSSRLRPGKTKSFPKNFRGNCNKSSQHHKK